MREGQCSRARRARRRGGVSLRDLSRRNLSEERPGPLHCPPVFAPVFPGDHRDGSRSLMYSTQCAGHYRASTPFTKPLCRTRAPSTTPISPHGQFRANKSVEYKLHSYQAAAHTFTSRAHVRICARVDPVNRGDQLRRSRLLRRVLLESRAPQRCATTSGSSLDVRGLHCAIPGPSNVGPSAG